MIGGYLLATLPGIDLPISGIVVASAALGASTSAEAIYAGLRVRPVLRRQVRPAAPVDEPVTLPAFLRFYTPLAMTSLLALVVQPVGSATLSRMPQALESLAVWPVLSGFVFLLRSVGMAYNEVVIALLEKPRSTRNLRRFAFLLATVVTVLLLITAATPLASFWFRQVSGLKPRLAALARRGLWLALLWPALNVLYSWYQGAVVHSRRTRPVTEAVVIYLFTSSVLLWAGVARGQWVGLHVAVVAFVSGAVAQTLWLWHRSRRAVEAVETRDEAATIRAVDISPR
jgi:O-antigen/teichoic acid export membrane protein